MSKITLNFFGEKMAINQPKTICSLRKKISELFCLSPQDAAEMLLTYKNNGNKITISKEEDFKAFLKSKINTIDLDISQNSKIYLDNLNQLQEESLKDRKILDNLLKKKEELKKLKETKFMSEKIELKKIQSQIFQLIQKKNEIRKIIFNGTQQIEKDIDENEKKIQELQKKLGIKNEKPKIQKIFPIPPKKIIPINQKMITLAPPINPRKSSNLKSCPNAHPFFFQNRPDIQDQKTVKFAEIEYIDIPKEKDETTIETNESNPEIETKIKAIEDWGNGLIAKTKEITNKLAEKYKDLESLNISTSSKNEDEKEEKKEVKEIHYNVSCDGCKMKPLIGKRYKCKGCFNFDYCEKCYEKNKLTHKHEFNLIEKPVLYRVRPNHHVLKGSSKGNIFCHPGMKSNESM